MSQSLDHINAGSWKDEDGTGGTDRPSLAHINYQDTPTHTTTHTTTTHTHSAKLALCALLSGSASCPLGRHPTKLKLR